MQRELRRKSGPTTLKLVATYVGVSKSMQRETLLKTGPRRLRNGGGEPGAGDRFRLAGWLAVRLGCGVGVKTFFVFISFD